jgi:hypothetical protein
MLGEWQTFTFDLLLSEPVRNGIYKPKEFHGHGTKIVNMGELFANPSVTVVQSDAIRRKTALIFKNSICHAADNRRLVVGAPCLQRRCAH